MTNRERLNRMDNEAYAREQSAFAACEVRLYVDYAKWLESGDPEYPIIGDDGVYDNGRRKVDCKIVGSVERLGNTYKRIVIKRPALHDFEMLTVPEANVVKT